MNAKRTGKVIATAVLLLASILTDAQSRRVVVSGYVRDAETGEDVELSPITRRDASLLPRIAAVDCLKGREVSVRRTDADAAPACGLCGGIASDGSLIVAGERVYAGEAHVC